MEVCAWAMSARGQPFTRVRRDESPLPGEVLVAVAGCGVCHTDLGFYYEGVPTRHPLPLTLGHEISGTVVAAGEGVESWVGRQVIVPAVIPCGACAACRAGRGSICGRQVFPGNDVHGGFATHVRVPARGLCPVPPGARVPLAQLAVLADAIATPYQAIQKSGLQRGDLAVFVGAGGVGGFGVQIAAAAGAQVVAIDVRDERLELMRRHGAGLALLATSDGKDLRRQIKAFAGEHGIPTWRWRIFETSGTPRGQQLAFGLLAHGCYLAVVGYTSQEVSVRLSNLMAFDATAEGCWGCLPAHYPAALALVLEGRIALEPFTVTRPLAAIQQTFADLHAGALSQRPILVPEPGA
jgi:6-hydroxycyclohex-1-ene-1-carbonyl-CoA dehydrogenase